MITIKQLSKKDVSGFKQLILLFKEVFEMSKQGKISDAYLKKLLAQPGFIALAAVDGNKVVGGLTAYEMPQYYGEYSEVYIYDIAIKSDYQRKGTGKKLLEALKTHCKKKGIKTMFVEAHAKDKHAVAFYLSTKGKAEEVMHFNYELNQGPAKPKPVY
jgi:aminoglycoside 3-N-acetyltransferase I